MTNGSESRAGTDIRSDLRSLGFSINVLRKQQGTTMVELAREAGVSQSYISEIETGKAMPSLAVLYSIAEQLGSTPANLLRTPADTAVGVNLTSSEQGTIHPIVSDNPDRGFFRAILTVGSFSLTEFVASPSDRIEGYFTHAGHECIYVAQGQLSVNIEGQEPVVLQQGDVLTYPAEIPHSWQTRGDEQVRVLQLLDRLGTSQVRHPHDGGT